MKIEQIVGRNIELYFKASGLNITNFGRKIDISNTTYVKKIFKGEVSIGIGKLDKIAKVLKVSVIDLMAGIDRLQPSSQKDKKENKKDLKKQKRKVMLSLMGGSEDWMSDEARSDEITRLARELTGGREVQKDLADKQKQIIHLVNQGYSNIEIGRKLECTREYVATISRQLKNKAYEDYISGLYQVEVNILKLIKEGLDVNEIEFKLNISEDDVKNTLEELEGLL